MIFVDELIKSSEIKNHINWIIEKYGEFQLLLCLITNKNRNQQI